MIVLSFSTVHIVRTDPGGLRTEDAFSRDNVKLQTTAVDGISDARGTVNGKRMMPMLNQLEGRYEGDIAMHKSYAPCTICVRLQPSSPATLIA